MLWGNLQLALLFVKEYNNRKHKRHIMIENARGMI